MNLCLPKTCAAAFNPPRRAKNKPFVSATARNVSLLASMAFLLPSSNAVSFCAKPAIAPAANSLTKIATTSLKSTS